MKPITLRLLSLSLLQPSRESIVTTGYSFFLRLGKRLHHPLSIPSVTKPVRGRKPSPPWSNALLAALLASGLFACSATKQDAQEFVEKGQSLLIEGETIKASLEFRSALQINPNLVPALYGLAQTEERLGNWEGVFRQLKLVVELDPNHLKATVKLAKLLLLGNQLYQALELSNTSFELAPEDPDVLAVQAAVLYKLEDREAAVEKAKRALAKAPDHPDALMLLAVERLEAGDAQEALNLLDRGAQETRDRVLVQLVRIKALGQLEQFDAAEAVYQRLIERYPDQQGLRHALAQFYLQRGRPEDAERQYREIAEANPQHVDAKLDLVRYIYRTKGAESAERELNGMIAVNPGEARLVLALAELHLANGELERAEKTYQAASEQFGDTDSGLTAKTRLASLLLDRGEVVRGMDLTDQVLSVDKRHGAALMIKAARHLETGDTDSAIAQLRSVPLGDPDSARTLLLLGRAHQLAGSTELAEVQYTRAFQAAPRSVSTGVVYAQFLLRRGKLERAEAVLQQVLGLEPTQPDALQMLAQIRLSQGEWAEAEKIAQTLKEIGELGSTASQIRGAALAGQRRFDESINTFQEAHESSPTEVQPIVALVRAFVASGKKQRAYDFLQNLLQANPGNEAALILTAQLYIADGKFDEAEQALQTATRLNPQNVLAFRNLSSFYLRAGRLKSASEAVRQGLEHHPGDFGLRLVLAGLQESFGDYNASIASYETLLHEKPDSDVVINNLASLLLDYRDDSESHQKALQLAQRFRNADFADFRDTLGWAHYRNGNLEQAKRILQKVVEQIPNVPIYRYHLGAVYAAASDGERARLELEEALRQGDAKPFPQMPQAQEVLSGLDASDKPEG